MINLKLPKRLSAIADMVPLGSFVADIGTDHAFLPIHLVNSGICSHCIASDIVDGPLQSAQKNISGAGLSNKISVIKSDGLVNVFPFTPDTIIIAGMGGETIRDIIGGCKFSKTGSPLFILQPMTHAEVLREFLHTNSFSILEEKVIQEERRFYVIIKAQYSENYTNDTQNLMAYYELGGISSDCEEHRNYLLWKKETFKKTLSGLKKADGFEEKISRLKSLILEIDRRLK